MKISPQPSPNHDSRGGVPIELLVLHYTGMKTGAEALARLCDGESRVSAHYLVEENGDVLQLVDEEMRAWHAGVASWRGHSNINARSIGIEIVNGGHEWGYTAFPQAQMQAVADLCQGILARHKAITPRNVVGHSDVAPARKQDPGEKFNWAWLAEQGVGLYVPLNCRSSVEDRSIERGAFASSWQTISQKLAEYGYGIETATPEQIITAFQRHFRPEKLDGIWDNDCQQRLEWLLEQAKHS